MDTVMDSLAWFGAGALCGALTLFALAALLLVLGRVAR